MAVTLESASHKGDEATTSSRESWYAQRKTDATASSRIRSNVRLAKPICIRRSNPRWCLNTHNQRQIVLSQCCNQLAHHNLSWNLPLASNFLPRDNNDSLQEKNEDKIDGKDKWVKRWEHFQFPIGVPDNDLGQVGLWREVLSFPVPNYLTSYPFSFIRACVCISVWSLIVCLSAKTGQDKTTRG